jgi:hypothetical protein
MLNVETRFEVPRIVQALKARGHGTCAFTARPAPAKPRWPSTLPRRWTGR